MANDVMLASRDKRWEGGMARTSCVVAVVAMSGVEAGEADVSVRFDVGLAIVAVVAVVDVVDLTAVELYR
jgi:hypothetical protein